MIRVFDYLSELEAFVVTSTFKDIADRCSGKLSPALALAYLILGSENQ